MEVLVHTRSGGTPLRELAERSDVVSLHVPATPQTEGLVDAAFLRAMQPTAYLINCARGAVVDQRALAAALRDGVIAGAGLVSRLVDLSFVVEASPRDLPAFMRIEVEYSDHAQGAAEFEQLLGVDRRLLRDEEGPAGERLSIGTHATTHVDAPWHYNSRIAGAPAATIDELPLDWFYGPGVVVDVRAKADGDPVTRSEMEQGIADAGHALAPRDIVLVHTGRDAFIAERDFMWRGPGVTPYATRWLYEQGVRVMGIDAWGWDAPLDGQAKDAKERDEPGILWAAHQADIPYSQIERLTNLAALPATGFTVACFPLKIKRASAAPARVVAILEGEA